MHFQENQITTHVNPISISDLFYFTKLKKFKIYFINDANNDYKIKIVNIDSKLIIFNQ